MVECKNAGFETSKMGYDMIYGDAFHKVVDRMIK